MWILDNHTPYGAGRNWTRDKDGIHHWLVAVQATFDINVSGRLTLSDEQPPPPLAPEFRGDPATSSLRRDSDLLALRPATDIIVDACAYAPKGKATPTVPVCLRVGELEKILVVHGTRAYDLGAFGLTSSPPIPFLTQPIQYEWAFGGSDTSAEDPRKHRIDLRNPVGKGVSASKALLKHKAAHKIEYPNGDPTKMGPAGYGAIASFWAPRLERAGTYGPEWEQSKKPLLPDDYDERYALSAPDDQRTQKPLRGGETCTLVNLTPEGALRFDLPKIFLTFRTRLAGRIHEHRATLATVFIAAEERKLSMVWQSSLRVRSPEVDRLESTTIGEKPYLS
jgi:hypothetical protein